MLDYLIAMGTKPHTVGQLRNSRHKMYGETKDLRLADVNRRWRRSFSFYILSFRVLLQFHKSARTASSQFSDQKTDH